MDGTSLPARKRESILWVLWYVWKNRNETMIAGKKEDLRILVNRAQDDAAQWVVVNVVSSLVTD